MMSAARMTGLGFAMGLALASITWAGENEKKPQQQQPAPTAPDPFHWGEAVSGLQLGLVPTGRGDTPEVRNVYFEGEGLKFALYLRNAGETDLTLLHASMFLPDFQILVTPKGGGKALVAKYDAAELPKNPVGLTAPVSLPRGSHGNCAMEFNSKWRFESTEGGAPPLKTLPVGKYVLEVVYQPQLAKNETGWQGKALTGSVDIEVRVKPAPSAGWSGGGGSAGGGGGGGARPVPRPTPLPRPLPMPL